MPLAVEFQQGRLGRPPEDGREQPGCLSEGAPLLPPLPATATATVGTESEGACITPDDLYRFLDTSSSSSSTSSNLFTTTTSYTGSTSLPYTTPSTASAPGPSFTAFDGANNAFGLDALFSSSAKEQPSTAFAAPAKAFDAGDILLPFDLAPSSASISAADLLAFPVFDTASTASQLPPLSLSADPLSVDATLDSPLGLTGSGYGSSTTSPLSEFLASPMFSLPGSAMASTTFSELPLPSPPSDAASATTALPFFPPLPSLPPCLDFTSTASTAFLRPSPPLPTPALPAAPSAASSASKGKKRLSKPTGFAPTATPLLPLDAPIQSRNSVLPSATSRKRKTAQAEKALAKRRKTAVSGEEATPAPAQEASAGAAGEEEDLPADIVAAVERKRLQNTLSARKSRARKQARLQELEMENEGLKARVEELERMLAVAAGRG